MHTFDSKLPCDSKDLTAQGHKPQPGQLSYAGLKASKLRNGSTGTQVFQRLLALAKREEDRRRLLELIKTRQQAGK